MVLLNLKDIMSKIFAYFKAAFATITALFANTKSLVLDGVNQYVRINDTSEIPPISNQTISFVVFGSDWNSTTRYFYGVNQAASQKLFMSHSNVTQINTVIDNFNTISSYQNILNIGEWNYLTVTSDWDGVNINMKLYSNGALITSLSGGFPFNRETYVPSQFGIGCRVDGSGNLVDNPYDDKIDKFTIWDKALSIDEIREYIQVNDLTQHSAYINLTHWYEFEDNGIVGTTLLNRIIGNSDATLVNGATNINCVPYPYPYQLETDNYTPLQNNDGGFSWDFDGVNDYINFPASPYLGSNPFSISVWLNLDTLRNEWGYIKQNEFELRGSNASRFFFRCYDTNISNYIEVGHNVGSAPRGIWLNLIITYDGSGLDSGLKMYQNTELLPQATSTVGVYTQMQNTGNPLTLGRSSAGFDSMMDNFIFFNKELSTLEIEDIYNDHQPRNEMNESLSANIIGYWRGRNSSIGTGGVLDMSTNSNNGTMVNMTDTDVVYDFPRQAFDLVNGNKGSFNFNGVNQLIDVGNVSELSPDRLDSFSVFSFCYPKDTSANGIVNKRQQGGYYRGWEFRFNNGYINLVICSTNATNQIFLESTNTFAINNWYNVGFSYDGSSDISGVTIYVDGVSVPFTTLTNNLSGTIINNLNFQIGLGRQNVNYFNGNLAQCTFINKELSICEVQELYNDGSPVDIREVTFKNDVVSHWCLDARDSPTGTVNDIVGTNNGTAINMVAGDLETDNYPTN
jgi:hypothetical protein